VSNRALKDRQARLEDLCILTAYLVWAGIGIVFIKLWTSWDNDWFFALLWGIGVPVGILRVAKGLGSEEKKDKSP